MKSNHKKFVAFLLVVFLLSLSGMTAFAEGGTIEPRLSYTASLEKPYGISDTYYSTGSRDGNATLEATLFAATLGMFAGAAGGIIAAEGVLSVATVSQTIGQGLFGAVAGTITAGSEYDTPNLYYHADGYQHTTNTFIRKTHYFYFADSEHKVPLRDYTVYYTKIPGVMLNEAMY